MKVPDLEQLVKFTSNDLMEIASAVSDAHKEDVIKNARGPGGKFQRLSSNPLAVYGGLSYRQWKQKTYNESRPNLHASGDMFNAFKQQGKPVVDREFSVRYGITNPNEAMKLNKHLKGDGVPVRAISLKNKPLPDPAVKVLLNGIANVIQKNFKKITNLDVQVVEI